MSYQINWTVSAGDPILENVFYQKYAGMTFQEVNVMLVKADIQNALASRESAAVINYLCWLTRVKALIA